MKQVLRLTESEIQRIIKEAVNRILREDNEPQDHTYSEREMEWLYDNQDGLTPIEQKVLNAGMWVRAMQANYHGYAKRWPNIAVRNGEVFYYGRNGELKRVP